MRFPDTASIDSPIHHLDPRGRLGVAIPWAILTAVSTQWVTIVISFLLAAAMVRMAKTSVREFRGKLLIVNLFALTLLLTAPVNSGGGTLFRIGALAFQSHGLIEAVKIGLKANTALLIMISLLMTIDLVNLGHALNHLRVPAKLAHLFLFTIRYVDLFHREYLRMRNALRVRGFHPRMNLHTYRTFANFAALLLIRGVDRADRVMGAMKCRCFKGEFYLFDHFHFHRGDACFVGVSLLALALLTGGEWWLRIQ